MKLHCPDCGADIPAQDMDLTTTIAKCRQCDSVFNFGEAVRAQQRHPAGSPPAKPPLLNRTRVQVEDFAGALRLTWKWFRVYHVFLIFFCIAWDSFLIFWYSVAFTSRHTPWLMIVFPIGHLAVGVGLTYFTITGLFNRTTVAVTRQELSVRHYPLPWPGNRTIPTDWIVQLHCEQNVSHGKNGSTHITYSLFASLKSGDKLKLAGGFEDIAEARTVEQLVEKYLKIPDRAVVGEYRS